MDRDEIPPGTHYLLMLNTLAGSGTMHGYEIANAIQPTSDSVLLVKEGSLHPGLTRTLVKGWMKAYCGHYGWESSGALLLLLLLLLLLPI